MLIMMESPLIELTRSLYHLDYFRRNFRKLGYHQCGGGGGGIDCLVCCFKVSSLGLLKIIFCL